MRADDREERGHGGGAFPSRVAALLATLAVACGGGRIGGDLPAGPDASDVATDADPGLPDDGSGDLPARDDSAFQDLPADGDPAPVDLPGDLPDLPAPDGLDATPEAYPDDLPADLPDAPADLPADLPDDPGPACDPDAGPCPCTTSDECPEGTYCDGTTCLPWACTPGSRFCKDSLRILCDRDGGGITILEDCDDGNPCTLGDGCEPTRCLPRTAMDCDDFNPCTVDACDRNTGLCVSTAADGVACQDGDPCTSNDTCIDGRCVAIGATDCRDGNPCTTDYCTSLLGCVHQPADGPCAPSADPCAVGGECRDAVCRDVGPDCDDGNPCTMDACESGACTHRAIPGCACASTEDCDDGDPCSTDGCLDGRCAHGPEVREGCCSTAADCDDGDPCTRDECAGFACAHAPAPDPACCASPVLRASLDGEGSDGFRWDAPDDHDVGWRLFVPPGGNGLALYFGNAAGTGYGTGTRAAGNALSPRLVLPAGVSLALSFRTWQDVEAAAAQDPFAVEAVDDTGRSLAVWSRPEGFPMRSWQSIAADLSPLAGRAIRLRFAFDSQDGVANDGGGVFLDDVTVTSPCLPTACAVESDCVAMDWHGACDGSTCDFGRSLQPLATHGQPPSPVAFASPSDVAVSPDGTTVYVSDRDAHVVQVLSADDVAGPVLGGYGTAPGRLNLPRGLAAAADRVYVADTGNHRLQAFSPGGAHLWSFGSQGDGPGRFNDPRGVALSADGGMLWVADTGNHRVQGLTPAGVVHVVIGGYGKLAGQLRSPACVAPLGDDALLVCDTQNHRLQVFGTNGAFRAVVAPSDGVPLNQPYGVAAAGPDAFWVSDSWNHRIVLMEASGRVRDRYGEFGSGAGGFAYPLGMEPDPSGGLWVVDSGNRRVVRLGRGPLP